MSEGTTAAILQMTRSAVRHTAFPRSHRLSGKLAFAAVYDAQEKEARGPLLIFSRPNGRCHPRLGLSVSRRVGTRPAAEPDQAAAPRGVPELHQHDLPAGYDLVVVVRPHGPMILAEYQRLLTP